MRDPIFYRWHAFIDSVFQKHKKRLTPYTESQLTFLNIVVDNIQIGTDGEKENVVNTHWMTTDFDLSSGKFIKL